MQVLITVDTEISPVEIEPEAKLAANVDRRIYGRTRRNEVGIAFKARTLNKAGLTGVFFVEALCASVVDKGLLRDWVALLRDYEQEIQLHVHAEWAQYLDIEPLADQTGYNISHYRRDDQKRLIGMALDNILAAGAPEVCAFRAGNYSANDDTLSALESVGLRYDTSYNKLYLGTTCAIKPVVHHNVPFRRGQCGVIPVTNFIDGLGRGRHAQLCACSAAEMRQALGNAMQSNLPTFVVVSHSFELLKPGSNHTSEINKMRWQSLVRFLSRNRQTMPVAGFHEINDEVFDQDGFNNHLTVSKLATVSRLIGQGIDRLV